MPQTQVSGSGIKDNVVTNSHLHSAANIASSKLADSGVTAGSYGSSSATLSLTINAKGIITSASTNAITQVGGSNGVDFNDNVKARFGTGNDLEIYHDGSDSYLDNSTGNLNLRVAGTENGIRLTPNGSVNLYYNAVQKLNTANSGVEVQGDLSLTADDPTLTFVDTNNNNFRITANTGVLYFADATANQTRATMTAAGIWAFNNNIRVNSDSAHLALGVGDDLQIFHDGFHSKISNSTGYLVQRSNQYKLSNLSEDHTYIKVPTHEGGVELYYDNSKKFETTTDGVKVASLLEIKPSTYTEIQDNSAYGLNIKHMNSKPISIATGGDYIQIYNLASSEMYIKCLKDAAVELYYNGTKKFETSNLGATVTGHLTTTGEIFAGDDVGLPDNAKITFGAGNDLKIQSDGSNALLLSDLLYINNSANSENILKATANGAVELYHDNVKQFATTSEGIHLPKGAIRGNSGTKVILGGTINPSQDKTWNFSFSTNAHGYNEGYVFAIKFYMNHWNHGNYFKYVEALRGGRGNVTGLNGHTAVEQLGATASNWNNGHIDYEVTLSGGTMNGAGASLFKVKYDADGAPAWTSGYYLEVVHSAQIGTVSIT